MYDSLIVGQGVAGTLMAHVLLRKGAKIMVYDNGYFESSSMAAAGIINPVTGRKFTLSWQINELLPTAIEAYRSLEKLLEISILRHLPVFRSLHSVKEENDWMLRLQDDRYRNYLSDILTSLPAELQGVIKPPHAGAFIYHAWQVDLPLLMVNFRKYLQSLDMYRIGFFDYSSLKINSEYFEYEDLAFKQIIFCEGYQSSKNPFFRHLPFDPVKGEALVIRMKKNLSCNVRDKLFITSIGAQKYWVGSTNEWDFVDAKPTLAKKMQLLNELEDVIDCEYEHLDHFAGVRPATKSRRPFVGEHPRIKGMFILGGMGTKGTSLSPFFAEQLADYIYHKKALSPEVNIQKYNIHLA